MESVPSHPKIYHITHIRNLQQIFEKGRLLSDAKRIESSLQCDIVGMSHIKSRRMTEIEVDCHAGTHVGDYVPFYFCPRSIMLYILHKGNHPDLKYTEGQGPIVHIQGDLHQVVKWAEGKGRRWAFSSGNAGARYVNFYNNLSDLGELNWAAIKTDQWNNSATKEAKQAEFLVYKSFPCDLIEKIGVYNQQMLRQVENVLRDVNNRPDITVEPSWYY